jgi:hypothetical protein
MDRRSILGLFSGLPLVGLLFRPGKANAEAVSRSSEAEDRKHRSIKRLKGEGVPTLEWLPVIEDSTQARPPSADAAARRFCALVLVAIKGVSNDQALATRLRAAFADRADLSPSEIEFMEDAAASDLDRVQFSWAFEAALPIAWALGRIQALDRPERLVDPASLIDLIEPDDGKAFVSSARMRPLAEILDAADLIYRYHWAVRDAGLKNRPAPARLDGEVVMERHRGLNWLIGYDAEWDEVTTDT